MSKDEILKKLDELNKTKKLAQDMLKRGNLRMNREIKIIEEKIDFYKKALKSFSDS